MAEGSLPFGIQLNLIISELFFLGLIGSLAVNRFLIEIFGYMKVSVVI